MPSRAAVFKWLAIGNEKGADPLYSRFVDQYTRAREEQADTIFDECLQIADDATNDYMDKINSEGEVVGQTLNTEHVQRSKLRIDTRKWMAGKMRPKKYGDKLEVEQTNFNVNISGDEADL